MIRDKAHDSEAFLNLIEKFRKNGGIVEENREHMQATSTKISVCARYAALRARFYCLNNKQFNKLIRGSKYNPDELVTLMTLLLSPDNEFEGGDLEIMKEGQAAKLKQGHAIFFASFIRHRVTPVIRGNRKSLVMWFGGTPFK